jgi:D-psicose/D-tagatose/L-ribulose 3-epimerase
MLPIGVNTWVWASPLTDDWLCALVPKVARMGFDAIELPLQSCGSWTPARAAELVAAHDLGVTVCAGLCPEHDLLTADTATRDRTRGHLRAAVDAAVTVGSGVVRARCTARRAGAGCWTRRSGRTPSAASPRRYARSPTTPPTAA